MRYEWHLNGGRHELQLVPVSGTGGTPYLFGHGAQRAPVEVQDFHMSSTPVTQALWSHVMGSNPAARPDVRCPAENVSWEQITGPNGFIERINAGEIRSAMGVPPGLRFRLPSETEWEYAARGGPRWTDDFRFSGSNDVDAVAWYGLKWSGGALKWRFLKTGLGRLISTVRRRETRTHDVATKAPNQLGLYDMSGNVWEWCDDTCTDEVSAEPPPADGTPYRGAGDNRRLRGGCHTNWDIHCTVWWRYGIVQDAHDGCIGFRVALA